MATAARRLGTVARIPTIVRTYWVGKLLPTPSLLFPSPSDVSFSQSAYGTCTITGYAAN